MRVGIDFRVPVRGARSGIERYTRSLVNAAVSLARGNEYYLYVDREPPEHVVALLQNAAERVEFRVIRSGNEQMWEGVLLPLEVRRGRLDVFFHPADVGGFWFSPKCPWVVDVHDIIPAILSNTFFQSPLHRLYYTWKVTITRDADAILTHSEWSQETILRRLRLPIEQVSVIPEGVDRTIFQTLPNCAMQALVRKQVGYDPSPFIFAIGSTEPRKNTQRLLRAYAEIRRRHPHVRLVLLDTNWRGTNLEKDIEHSRLSGTIVRLQSPITDDALAALYNAAELFLFPSLYEGFGLPVLEAMACGTPVVTSNRTALPEVAGGAARLVEPESEHAIADACIELLEDGTVRARHRQMGLARVRGFSWVRSAERVVDVFQTVATARTRRMRSDRRGHLRRK